MRVRGWKSGCDFLGELGRGERLAPAQQDLGAREPDARILLGGVAERDEPALDGLELSRRDQLRGRRSQERGRELQPAAGQCELDRVGDTAVLACVRNRLFVQLRPAHGIARLERPQQEAPDERVESEEPVTGRDE